MLAAKYRGDELGNESGKVHILNERIPKDIRVLKSMHITKIINKCGDVVR